MKKTLTLLLVCGTLMTGAGISFALETQTPQKVELLNRLVAETEMLIDKIGNITVVSPFCNTTHPLYQENREKWAAAFAGREKELLDVYCMAQYGSPLAARNLALIKEKGALQRQVVTLQKYLAKTQEERADLARDKAALLVAAEANEKTIATQTQTLAAIMPEYAKMKKAEPFMAGALGLLLIASVFGWLFYHMRHSDVAKHSDDNGQKDIEIGNLKSEAVRLAWEKDATRDAKKRAEKACQDLEKVRAELIKESEGFRENNMQLSTEVTELTADRTRLQKVAEEKSRFLEELSERLRRRQFRGMTAILTEEDIRIEDEEGNAVRTLVPYCIGKPIHGNHPPTPVKPKNLKDHFKERGPATVLGPVTDELLTKLGTA